MVGFMGIVARRVVSESRHFKPHNSSFRLQMREVRGDEDVLVAAAAATIPNYPQNTSTIIIISSSSSSSSSIRTHHDCSRCPPVHRANTRCRHASSQVMMPAQLKLVAAFTAAISWHAMAVYVGLWVAQGVVFIAGKVGWQHPGVQRTLSSAW